MPFTLSRSGNNVPAEVQRWQYFLLRRGIVQAGRIDAHFGMRTEQATKIFQMQQQLAVSGKADVATLQAAATLGYTIVPDTYYRDRRSPTWPPAPGGLRSPSSQWRNAKFGCFNFIQRAKRDRPERIVITGSCDGTVRDWAKAHIVEVRSSAFAHAEGFQGSFLVHAEAKDALEDLLAHWKDADLLHLVINYAGASDPRYIKGHNPGNGPQAELRSTDASKLSNHAFGSAFDINTTWNWIGKRPALCGEKGAVRELVEIANKAGFYWGGHFGGGRIDGMHFELAA